MNKEKWYSIGYLALSIFFLLIVLGAAAWHFFHDHHDDTRHDSSAGIEPVSYAIAIYGDELTKTRTRQREDDR